MRGLIHTLARRRNVGLSPSSEPSSHENLPALASAVPARMSTPTMSKSNSSSEMSNNLSSPSGGSGGLRKSQSISSIKVLASISTNSPSLEDLRKGSAFSFNGYVAKAANAFNSSTSAVASASYTMQPDSPVENLRSSHYVHSELQFIMALIDIGNRLRSVPKPARQSSLVAELTLLNHNLPANVCMPLWCPGKGKHSHHKILRISPNDAVVLNSADRVKNKETKKVV
jgi:hypothetical protein